MLATGTFWTFLREFSPLGLSSDGVEEDTLAGTSSSHDQVLSLPKMSSAPFLAWLIENPDESGQ